MHIIATYLSLYHPVHQINYTYNIKLFGCCIYHCIRIIMAITLYTCTNKRLKYVAMYIASFSRGSYWRMYGLEV